MSSIAGALHPANDALVLATLDPIGAMAGRDDEKLKALLADVTVDAGLLVLLGDLRGSEPKAGVTDPDESRSHPPNRTSSPASCAASAATGSCVALEPECEGQPRAHWRRWDAPERAVA